jgi:septum formation protein
MTRPIVLASGSPRRRQLLEMLRIPFQVIAPDVDEHVRDGEQAAEYVTRVSRTKAETIATQRPDDVVLAADTTVVLGGEIFGKPDSPEHAVAMLVRLQGRTHEVMTSVAVMRGADLAQALDVSRVTFRPADEPTLAAYVATGEPLDKAGAYAIQGLGAPLIDRVEGDFFGVMGLPLRLALDLLGRFGRTYRFGA